jgi:group I intron endonuclease
VDLLFSSGSIVYTGSCFSGIYGIQCHETSKWYVGESIHVPQRIEKYLNTIQSTQPLISSSFAKYGKEAFSCYKLEECAIEKLHSKETEWSIRLDSIAPNGYNLRIGGNGKYICSEDTRRRISESLIGKTISEETRSKMSKTRKGRVAHNKGKSPSFISIEKQRAKMIGKIFTEEHKRKIGEANKRRKGMKYKKTLDRKQITINNRNSNV